MSRFEFSEDIEDNEDFFDNDILESSTDHGGKGEQPLPGGKVRRSIPDDPLKGLNKAVNAQKTKLLHTLDPTKLNASAVDKFLDRIDDRLIADQVEELRAIYLSKKNAYTGSVPFPDFEVDVSKLGMANVIPNLAGTVMEGIAGLGVDFVKELSGVTDRLIEAIETCNGNMDIFKLPGLDLNLGILAGLELVLCAATKGDGTLIDAVLNAVDNVGVERVILKGATGQAAKRGNVKALNEIISRSPTDHLVADNPSLPYNFINNLPSYNDAPTRAIIPKVMTRLEDFQDWGVKTSTAINETHINKNSKNDIKLTIDNILTVQSVGSKITALSNVQILKSLIGD